MALRGDSLRLIPLLRHMRALQAVIPYSDTLSGSFQPLIDTHVKNPWLLSWLDALAFSLSGLPAGETGAATMAYTLFDLHREGAALDYPRGGFGEIASAFVKIINETGSKVFLNSHVSEIAVERGRAVGVKLSRNNQFIKAKRGVVCNANIWSLPRLLERSRSSLNTQQQEALLMDSARVTKTASFMHLHMGVDAAGLDLSKLCAHYTVMDKGLHRNLDGSLADPCGDRNMVAVSNPSILDPTLVNKPGKLMIHAYGAGNEPSDYWKNIPYNSNEYKLAKNSSSEFLTRSVARALDISVKELSERTDVQLVGSPHTHARYLQREEGTYGATFKSMLSGPKTNLKGLYLCGDSVFPGIGVPAVAVSGASAANTMVSITRHMFSLMNNEM